MSIEIKQVSSNSELAAIEKIAQSIWRQHYTPIIGAEQVEYMLKKFQSLSAMLMQLADGYRYYSVFIDQALVGYFSVQERKDHLFLSKFYIDSQYRGQGIGVKAMEYVVELGKELNCSHIELTVNKYNTDSIDFYLKRGFSILEDVVFDIGGGFVMDDKLLGLRIED